jgi:peptidoglycan/xylan/chitin deacetylase (PgdA/CDA1 family)
MNGTLNKNQIEYVFYHLSNVFDFHEEIKNRILFENSTESNYSQAKIIFPLSGKPIEFTNILYINSIPVLFPLTSETQFYKFENKNLVFNHDILKSAFYLLSGYQEYKSEENDVYDRFPFKASIQNKLSFTRTPVVNYYFEAIAEGIEKFCQINNIRFTRKKLFDTFGFILSHDIDRIDSYDFWETGSRLKQAFGLIPRHFSRFTAFKEFMKGCLNLLHLKNENKFWNFEYLRKVERENDISSVFFFLEKELKHKDSKYQFSEERIRNLIKYLENEGCEIGIHGTTLSAENYDCLTKTLTNLQKETSSKVIGIRQHFLRYQLPKTALIQEKAGLKYDSTLGFAEHEGFRNSCCLPFKPYDFENDRMIDVWEFPLIVMDGTLFYYRNLSFGEINQTTDILLNEIKKFNGLFVLLWHNSMFDENEFPGITAFYEEYLKKISSEKPQSITGSQLLKIL